MIAYHNTDFIRISQNIMLCNDWSESDQGLVGGHPISQAEVYTDPLIVIFIAKRQI